MSVHRIASRYAKSFIELAEEKNKLERIKEDVESFHSALESRDFVLLLKSPIIHNTKKKAVIKVLFEDKFDELTMAFLNILVHKNREAYLPEIAKEFLLQYKIFKHITTAKIVTASNISDDIVAAIQQKLESIPSTDEHVEIVTEVDPDLIGGFVLEFSDWLYDTSVVHKLELLKKEFKDNPFTSQIIAR